MIPGPKFSKTGGRQASWEICSQSPQAAAAQAEFKRQTQAYQRSLPRPSNINLDALFSEADKVNDPVAHEAALLMAHDAIKLGDSSVIYNHAPISDANALPQLQQYTDTALSKAKMEVALEMSNSPYNPSDPESQRRFEESWEAHSHSRRLLDRGSDVTVEELAHHFDAALARLSKTAAAANEVEKRLSLHLGGYQQRAKMLRGKIGEAAEALGSVRREEETMRWVAQAEEGILASRLEEGRRLMGIVGKREREAQEAFREVREMRDEILREERNGKERGMMKGKGKRVEAVGEQAVEA